MADTVSKSTQVTEPWSGQSPYLTAGFTAAKNLWNQPGPAYFPGSTVAPFSPAQTQAQGMVQDIATGGNPLFDAASGYALDVLGGNVNDPYADPVFQNIQSKVMPGINSQYMMGGRLPSGTGTGSNAYADTMTRALTEAYAPWASQNWQFAQQQKENMAKFAPELRKFQYYDAGALSLLGQEQQQQAQKELQDAQARWDFYQNQPQQKLADYMSVVGGQEWGQSQTTKNKVPGTSTLDSILGIAGGLVGGLGDIFGGSLF